MTFTTEWKNPVAALNVDRDGKNSWSNVNSSLIEDGVVSTNSIPKNTYGDWLRNTFQFEESEIPNNATVKGIEIRIKKMGSMSTGIKDSYITLSKLDLIRGWNMSLTDYYPLTLTFRTHGYSTALWGLTWNVSDIRTFYSWISCRNADTSTTTNKIASIDIVNARITYEIPFVAPLPQFRRVV